MKWLYPEDYTAPEPPPPVELTPTERGQLKTWLQGQLNQLPSTKRISMKQGIQIAQERLLNNVGKHIHDRVIKEILEEIQNEWYPDGPPGSGHGM